MARQISVIGILSQRCVEPQRRMVGGRFGWAVHRFPIKGGISLQHAMNIDLMESMSRLATLTCGVPGAHR
ncbi:hypothetical protein BN948_01763 [Hydrogenophaga intermedia]|uniref:Uncharacterized protein n=1 Tax=Hydrogenophaga intermedia TaxID=65786 RepID=A0A1L1PRW8_HYDIT|nr:hypothetical protein [Hydrogenophaga intermedia]CDN87341.1 hypothetical protein BN948_01763 [Hydrogenophaga intermedia]